MRNISYYKKRKHFPENIKAYFFRRLKIHHLSVLQAPCVDALKYVLQATSSHLKSVSMCALEDVHDYNLIFYDTMLVNKCMLHALQNNNFVVSTLV